MDGRIGYSSSLITLGASCDSRARNRVSYISSILLREIRYSASHEVVPRENLWYPWYSLTEFKEIHFHDFSNPHD